MRKWMVLINFFRIKVIRINMCDIVLLALLSDESQFYFYVLITHVEGKGLGTDYLPPEICDFDC